MFILVLGAARIYGTIIPNMFNFKPLGKGSLHITKVGHVTELVGILPPYSKLEIDERRK